jgi:hypothetical protein
MFRHTLTALTGVFAIVIATHMIGQTPSDSVQVTAGVYVPSKGSVWVVAASNLTASPVQLYRSQVHVNRHVGRNVAGELGGSFLYRPSMSIELQGPHAEARLNIPDPVFYIRQAATFEGEGDLRPGTVNNNLSSDLTLVRLRSDKDKRVEESMSTNGFGTGAKRKLNQITVTRRNLDSGWLELKPSGPLEPGEYAIVALPRAAAFFSEYAYDFGIDPAKATPEETNH